MKQTIKTILILNSLFPVPCSLFPVPSAPAAVTLRWTVETSRLQPAVFDVVRGETLNLEAAFQTYGKPLSMAAKPCSIFYQTNGMGSAWWTAPATATSNQVSVTFTPEMDPGATVINGFLGSTGDIYRAAFTLRYRHGPGAAPNALEPPAKITAINWSTVYNSNVESAPFVVKGGSGGLTPQDAGNIATNSIDAKVASWALKPNPAPVTDLTTALDYTTAVSNKLEVAVSQKRGLTDFDVYGEHWSCTLPEGYFIKDPQPTITGNDFDWPVTNSSGSADAIIAAFNPDHTWSMHPHLSHAHDNVECWIDGIATTGAKLTRTSATSGLAKFGADGVLTAATEGVDYLKTHQDISGKVNTSGTTALDSGTQWTCGPYSIGFSADGIMLSGYIILPDTIYTGNNPPWTSYSFNSFATATSISNDFPIVTNAYTKAEANEASTNAANAVYFANVTGDVENISAPVATNAATSVVSNYLDYALAPLSGTSVNISSGEIGNLSLTSEQTTLTVNLDFSAAEDRSGDCMLYLINEADTDMTVGPSSVITIGWDGADIKAGTNVVMFTRIKREGDNSLVMVSTKEIK